jgi:hypothetical protein
MGMGGAIKPAAPLGQKRAHEGAIGHRLAFAPFRISGLGRGTDEGKKEGFLAVLKQEK